MSNFDTTPADEVMQAPVVDPTVGVEVRNVVRVDEMPCFPYPFFKVLRGGQGSQKILQRNDKRKMVVIQNLSTLITGAVTELILVSRTKGECDQFTGALLSSENALTRFEFPWPEELWARGVEMTSAAGVVGGFTASTTDALLSVVSFDWTR